MTGEEYRQSLRAVKGRIFALGERIADVTRHSLTQPHVNAAALTYDLAHQPEHRALATATSHLSGKAINRFLHVHQSPQDLVAKVKLLRLLGQMTGTCFQRCPGWDALNALYTITYLIDQKYQTQYHQRLRRHLAYLQERDLMSAGGMTDPKGDRSLPPSQQADPDLYLHIVERRQDGIVVRGAKAHQTGAVNSHEVIAMPTSALREEDRDYAVSFAIPIDAPGITLIFGRQSNDERRLSCQIDQGNACYGIVGGEALIVFDDVFVPWERVFLAGEYDFAGPLVEMFAACHRQNYGGCKGGVADVIIGASAQMAEYNGVGNAAHIRDKLVEMVHLAETMYNCSIACSAEGRPTPAGACHVDVLLANTAKLNATRFVYEIGRLAQDIAGGLIATLPSEQDLRHPEVGKYVEKYFKGVASVPTEHRLRLARLLENMTGGSALVESMHGAGSPQAMRIMLLRQANLEYKKGLARALAGIDAGR